MVNLRKAAKGQICQIRIPGYCNHNPETSVLAHYRLAGTCGTAIKPHDMQAAIAC
ncbi:nuclease domain-containing protein, partial [Escherichia coli]